VSYLDILDAELQEFGIPLSDHERLSLATYCDELVHWNKKINLTALSDARLVRRLVVEPVWIARALKLSGALMDIGSGNGSPAIPFQIVVPTLTSDLIEARAKRAAFLRHLCQKLKLSSTRVHHGKFEDIASDLPKPDWITLQAVALTPAMLRVIRAIALSTTTIVWITTTNVESPLKPFKSLTVPITGTQVLLFHLDLS
jgi:16S rRNA (guanine(527)-N(7))-methyltransferase RsmG